MRGMKRLAIMGVPGAQGGAGTNVAEFTVTTTGAETLTFLSLDVADGETLRVDWGDDSSSDLTGTNSSLTHEYAAAGAYALSMFPVQAVKKITYLGAALGCEAGTIGKFTGLTYLYMSASNVTIGAGEIAKLTNLTILRLDVMGGVTVGAGELANLTKLTLLRLGGIGSLANAPGDLAAQPALTSLTLWAGLTETQVDQVLADLYAQFPTRTGINGTISLLGSDNAAPTGTSPGSAECPPTTGWNTAYELVNDSCDVSPKHWASVSLQT